MIGNEIIVERETARTILKKNTTLKALKLGGKEEELQEIEKRKERKLSDRSKEWF